MDRKNGEFGFGQSVLKRAENLEQLLFYDTYSEESNINWKPLIWSHDKIITKFGQKKLASLVLGKAYESCRKIKRKCYYMKLTLKRVIPTKNSYFVPR